MSAAEIAGLTLLHFFWQGAAVALTLQLLLVLVGRSSAAARYGIACAALMAMVALPAITSARLAGGAVPVSTSAFGSPVKASVETGATAPSTTVAERPRFAIASSSSRLRALLTVIAWAWALGVALLTIRTAAGWWRVRRLYKLALRSPQSKWREAVAIWADRLQLRNVPRVVESAGVDTPAVVGWLRPIVLLPIASLASLTPTQVEAILVHELAHIRRHDYLVNLLQSAVETALFYHPAVWWVSAIVRAEREHCCDDLAVRFCGDRHAYADALVVLESKRFVSGVPLPAATDGPLSVRVARILQLPARSSSRPSPFPAIGLTLALVLAAGFVPAQQQMVSGATQATANQVDWALHATDRLEIYYRPGDAASVDAVVRAAGAAYDQISTALQHDLETRVPIVLLTSAEISAAGPGPGFTPISLGASVSGPQLTQRARLILPLDRFPQQPRLLAHEMTHQFLFDIEPKPRGSGIPVWLHEGLADYMAGEWTADARRIVRTGVVDRTLMASELEGQLRQRADEDVQHLAHAVIEFIDHEFGHAGIRRFLATVRSATSANASIFVTAFGTSATDFDRQFDRFIQERFGR